MTSQASGGSGDAAPPVIDSRRAWSEALRWGFERAIDADARRIVCVDPDFADWPLDDAALQSRLAGWLRRPQRRWVLLSTPTGFDALPQRHPRWCAWRTPWAHAIDTLAPPADEPLDWPALLVDDGDTVVRLLDRARFRGRAEADAAEARRWREGLDDLLQRCDATFPVTRLGL